MPNTQKPFTPCLTPAESGQVFLQIYLSLFPGWGRERSSTRPGERIPGRDRHRCPRFRLSVRLMLMLIFLIFLQPTPSFPKCYPTLFQTLEIVIAFVAVTIAVFAQGSRQFFTVPTTSTTSILSLFLVRFVIERTPAYSQKGKYVEIIEGRESINSGNTIRACRHVGTHGIINTLTDPERLLFPATSL